MTLIKVKPCQSLQDIALESYGTLEAISELLTLNPLLKNDPQALTDMGVDGFSDNSFFIDVALITGSSVVINKESNTKRTQVLRLITNDITTY